MGSSYSVTISFPLSVVKAAYMILSIYRFFIITEMENNYLSKTAPAAFTEGFL